MVVVPQQLLTPTISGKDHHDEITAKIIKPSTLSIREKKALILASSR
jgi:hypothetical protein